MQISNNTINFQSKYKFVNAEEFKKLTANLSTKTNFVDYPWTIETMKHGKNLYTTGLMNCIAGLITDGSDSNTVMFHLATRTPWEAKRDFVSRFSIKNIEQRIKEKIDLNNKSLHAFFIGGFSVPSRKKMDDTSQFWHLKGIADKYGIPCSIIGLRKDVHHFGHYGIYYNNDSDTVYLTNTLTDSDICYNYEGKIVNEIEPVENEVIYADYKKVPHEIAGWTYEREFKKSDLETFFKHEFKEVSLCELDEWA